MSDVKIVAASIVHFLKQQLEGRDLSLDSRESVEVGIQCIETAFELKPDDLARALDLLPLVKEKRTAPDVNDREQAERLKNEGNELMKADRHHEALAKYTAAIDIDPHNSVYFCNRAAAHFKLGTHESAVADCTAALALQPNYGKAHGRLGIALTALERHADARNAFARASELEPDNESYKQNLRLAEDRLAARGPDGRVDIGGLLHNPTLLNMATDMLADPGMQTIINGLMSSAGGPAGGAPGGMGALLQAGQALAQHMQSANPELVQQLRRQMRAPGDSPPPPAPPAPPAQ